MTSIDDIRGFVREPRQVWSRDVDNLRVVVVNYGNPKIHQVHKLRLIIKLEKSIRNDSSDNPVWKSLSWVDCTFSAAGEISDLSNWFCNKKVGGLEVMLMEVGIRGMLEEYHSEAK